MNKWEVLIENKNKSIGEVAGIESDIIDVYIYPECYSKVSFGSILIINSSVTKPMGIVIKLAHLSRYPTFTPMRMTRDEIEKTYPDLETYHLFVSSIVYTSHLDEDKVRHYRSSSPMLHDLVYLINDENLLDAFFKPEGQWDFSFLNYLFNYREGVFTFRDFLNKYKYYFSRRESEKEYIVEAIIREVERYHREILSDVLLQISAVLNW